VEYVFSELRAEGVLGSPQSPGLMPEGLSEHFGFVAPMPVTGKGAIIAEEHDTVGCHAGPVMPTTNHTP
jgi:hypothetical protein